MTQSATEAEPSGSTDDEAGLCALIFHNVEASVDYVGGSPIAVLSDVKAAADAIMAAGFRRCSTSQTTTEAHTWETPELEQLAAAAQEGYQNPIAQVAFRAGFIFCREYMARFVEQGGDATTAQSIRANWIPHFGVDPGGPRKYDFAEIATAEDMEVGPWASINPGPSVDAAVYALSVMGALGMSERPSPCAPENGGWLGPDLAAKADALANPESQP